MKFHDIYDIYFKPSNIGNKNDLNLQIIYAPVTAGADATVAFGVKFVGTYKPEMSCSICSHRPRIGYTV